MKIENPNKEFKPISLIIENQIDLDRIKEILQELVTVSLRNFNGQAKLLL